MELFGNLGVDFAILTCQTGRIVGNPRYEAALCAATNSWLAKTWLSSRHNPKGQYRGSIHVSSDSPVEAVKEIHKWAGHPYFVQVVMVPSSRAPLGQVQYHPIYAAAAKHDLPIAIHVRRIPGMALLSPVGYASYFFEHHAEYSLVYMAHVVSFIAEGVFNKWESLKLVLLEGGVSWVAPLLWRLDHYWHEFGAEVPWLTRPPSSYLRDNLRITLQPIEEPGRWSRLHSYLEWVDAEHTLMFSSDYPHWDFDDPQIVARAIPESIRGRVMAGNAVDLYRLPEVRPDATEGVHSRLGAGT